MIDLEKLKSECAERYKSGYEMTLYLGHDEDEAKKRAPTYVIDIQNGVLSELIDELEEWRKMEFRVAGLAKGEEQWLTQS